MAEKNIRDYVIEWNSRFPYDRWWRKKYNIPFNSKDHKESSFLDQLFDYEEDIVFSELASKEEYVPNIGDWLRVGDSDQTLESSIKSLRDEFKDLPDGQDDTV